MSLISFSPNSATNRTTPNNLFSHILGIFTDTVDTGIFGYFS